MNEEPIYTVQPSFSHGEVSPFLFGRTDLQAYTSGLRTSRNGFIRTEGSWSNRQGTIYCNPSSSYVPLSTVLIPFTFNVGQSYIIEFGAQTIQVLFQGIQIPWTAAVPATSTTPAVPAVQLGVTPYAAADLPLLRYSQSADTLTLVHPNYPPQEFKRTSATTFTFEPAVYTMGPFLQQNIDGTTFVSASGTSGLVSLTASSPIFNQNHVGALFQLTQQDISAIVPWEAETRLNPMTGYIAGILGLRTRSNGKNYVCVGYPNYNQPPGAPSNANAITTGSVAPAHAQGTQADGSGLAQGSTVNAAGVLWQYTDSGFGVVLITQFVNETTVEGIVQPNYTGGPGLLPVPVVGGPQADTAAGSSPWSFTGDGATTTFSVATSTQFDPNKFYVLFDNVYQPPALYAISTTGNNIVFNSPPAAGVSISVEQILSLGQTTYWAFGAFSPDQGYPSTASYVPDRLILAATPQQPVGVFGSQTSVYHNFGVSNPVVNSDAFAVFLNARQLNKISDIVPLQDLMIGTANIMWRLWPGANGQALGPLYVEATPQAFMGESPNVAAVLYGDSMLYAIYGGRRIRDLVYQFQFDKYVGSELTAYSRHLIPFGTQIVKMQYAPDPWGQVYVLRSDGVLLTCTYVRDQQMIAWSRWDTPGTIEDIAVVPEDNSYVLYLIANRTIDGETVRYIEKLSQWETETIYDYKHMDCSLTYDGRNTSATTMTLTGGTTWSAGDVGVLDASGTVGWASFASTDPNNGNIIQLFDASGTLARCIITGFNSATEVTVRFADPIPADLQGTPILTWTFARKNFTGCNQLAGQTVACISDGNAVVGLNGVPLITVGLDGTFSLPTPGGVVCVGLQYFSDLETLALNIQGQETIRMRAKGVPHVYLDVTGGRGLMAGTDFDTMYPVKERAFEAYLDATANQEGIINTLVDSEFDSESHVCVRQPFPLPITIRMVIPAINVGEPVG